MSAPTVKKQAKTVRGKQKDQSTVKKVLLSPYAPEWPVVAVGETPKILQEIQRIFEPYRILPNMKKIKQGKKWSEKRWTPDSLQRVNEAKELKAQLRSHIVFGVNATTKCLEKGQLDLVIVCRSSKPPLMTSHLMTLAACRGVPALALAGLSETLSKMMRARAIIAVGFKKRTEDSPTEFSKLMDFIIEKTPPIELPWLQYKDITLEELRQKVTEASNLRKRGKKGKDNQSTSGTPSRAPPGLRSKKETVASLSGDKHHLAESQELKDSNKEHELQDNQTGELGNTGLGISKSAGRDGSAPVKRKKEKPNSDIDGRDNEECSNTAKRRQLDAESDKTSRKVSKITHISGKVIPVRSVPKEMKQEWKRKKGNKKKKKKL